MQRRSFLKNTTGVLAASSLRSGWLHALSTGDWIDLRQVSIITPTSHTAREANAARVLVEESYKRCGLDWSIEANPQGGALAIYAGTRASWSKIGQREATSEGMLKLSWTREAGLGGNGAGCQVAEVWLIPTCVAEPS